MTEPERMENIIFNNAELNSSEPADESDDCFSEKSLSKLLNADGIDSGRVLHSIALQYAARIRQLKSGLSSSQKENDQVVDEYLIQNLELMNLNKNLECKVKERTHELEVANMKQDAMNNNLILANERLGRQTLQLEQLNESKEALMHMVVHDLKNPVAVILGTLALFARNSFNLPSNIHKLLLSANTNGIKLLSMIEEILMISRMKTREFKLKPEQTNLIKTVSDCVELMQKTSTYKKINFSFTSSCPEFNLLLDAQIIERVINNLLNNAIKYAPQKSGILVQVTLGKDRISISVTNRGDAIPKKHHKTIFELFTRVKKDDTQFSGTGIGLAFCKFGIEAHGGTIEIISPVPPMDDGACFLVHLPLPADIRAAE